MGVQDSGFEQLLSRNVERFRGGLVSKAHRLLCHSTVGSKAIKKKKKKKKKKKSPPTSGVGVQGLGVPGSGFGVERRRAKRLGRGGV